MQPAINKPPSTWLSTVLIQFPMCLNGFCPVSVTVFLLTCMEFSHDPFTYLSRQLFDWQRLPKYVTSISTSLQFLYTCTWSSYTQVLETHKDQLHCHITTLLHTSTEPDFWTCTFTCQNRCATRVPWGSDSVTLDTISRWTYWQSS